MPDFERTFAGNFPQPTSSPLRPDLTSSLDELATLWTRAEQVAVLTGAGISAESGVPTFRGKEGLWNSFKAEELATLTAFLANPKLVWEWYNWRRELIANISPNPGHHALAELELLVPRFTLITQNVDGLHRRAGTRDLLELHGTIASNCCVDCHREADGGHFIDPNHIQKCAHCGGLLRPGVVWFGENLDDELMDTAYHRARSADLFLVIGTSALVYPASQLPLIAKEHGATLVEINIEPTPLTPLSDYVFQSPAGECLPQLLAAVRDRERERATRGDV